MIVAHMIDVRPAVLLHLIALVFTAFVIVTVNNRVDLTTFRGGPSAEPLAIVILGFTGGLVLLVSLVWRSRGFAYSLVPLTAVVITFSYVLGTARFD
jgi:hypothetical protein